jgi:PAS domain S-box-containing protein
MELQDYAALMGEAEQIAGFGVFRWEIGQGRVQWSAELERIYGLDVGTFPGTVEAFVDFLHPGDRTRIWNEVEQTIATGRPFVWQERIIRPDGEERVLISRGRPVVGETGEVESLVGICHDVTPRVSAERALGHSERRMRAILDYSPSLIAVKDLSHRYLMANAETGRLLGIPPEQVIGRVCAEVFPTVGEQMQANDVRAVAELAPVFDDVMLEVDGEPRTFLTVTFALPDDGGRPIETCTIATDVTERRRDERQVEERLRWAETITSALAAGQMRVFAQPVVELAGGRVCSRELLIRMQPADGDAPLQLPGAFLPTAEQFGLIQSIDVWMVEQALRLAADGPVEVNLSAASLSDADTRRAILQRLREAPEMAAELVFEVTETAAVGSLEAACAFSAELTDLGVGLALDDFGTGFGSFTYLRRLPLRYLKIDISFVRNLPRSIDDQRVVRSTIAIAREFGLQTIAEGVEDAATVDLLGALGADYAQGNYLGSPADVSRPLSGPGDA